MEIAGFVLQTATVVFVIVVGIIHIDRRITRLETKFEPLWEDFVERKHPDQMPLFKPARD